MASSNYTMLAHNQDLFSNGKYMTFSHGCQTFERVLFEIDLDQQSSVSASVGYVTISAGGENICNRIPIDFLAKISQFNGGTGLIDDHVGSGKDAYFFEVDTGVWSLDKGDELLVSVTGDVVNANDQVYTIHAEVNSVLPPSPKRYLYRTDSSFKVDGVTKLYAYKTAGTSMDEITSTCSIAYGSDQIEQSFASLNCAVNCDTVGDLYIENLAVAYDGLARDLVVNTTESNIVWIAEQDVPVTNRMLALSRRFITSKLNQITSAEKRFLRNR